MADHVACEPQTKSSTDVYGQTALLRRIPCSCGWAGCWYARPEHARRSWERHVARVREEASA